MAKIGYPISCKTSFGQDLPTDRRSPLIRFTVVLVSLCLFPAMVACQTLPVVVDPVFGLKYSTAKIKFDPAPPALLTSCPDLKNGHWSRRLWIYAEDKTANGTYLILGGLYEAQPPTPAKLESDPKGAVVLLNGLKCTLLGPAREVIQYPEDLITKPNLKLLVQNLVSRYRNAFGGNAQFRAALRDGHVDLMEPRDAVLRDALESTP